jgi:hypothetical protein
MPQLVHRFGERAPLKQVIIPVLIVYARVEAGSGKDRRATCLRRFTENEVQVRDKKVYICNAEPDPLVNSTVISQFV